MKSALLLFYIAACSVKEISNLVLSGASTGLTTTTSDFHLSNVVIKNSQIAVLLTKTSNITIASLVNCIFDGNQYAIDLQLYGRVLVTSTVFTNNQYGIFLKFVHTPALGNNYVNSLEIRGSHFLQNFYALFSDDVNDEHPLLLHISDSLFQASDLQLIGDYHCAADVRTEIDQCSFDDSRISASSCSKYTVSINSSSFFNSAYSPISLTGTCRSLLILNSNISYNKAGGLYLDAHPSGVFRIERNLFSRNTGSTCISLTFQNSRYLPPGNVSVVGNSFLDNSVTNVIYMNDVSPDKLYAIVLENRFENPTSKFELYINTSWKSNYFLDAKQNWWGSSDERFIESRIYDFFSDVRLAVVDTASVYLDSGMTSLVDSNAWRDFDANSSHFGGVLRQSVTINMESMITSTIYVTNSILVPSHVQLQLIGSKVVNFAKLTGIVVEGSKLFSLKMQQLRCYRILVQMVYKIHEKNEREMIVVNKKFRNSLSTLLYKFHGLSCRQFSSSIFCI